MAVTWKDWLKQTISSGGTGALTLSTASSGYQAFAAGDDGKLFPYSIQDGTAWEVGYGIYTHSGTSFARTSRTASSTGSALNVSTSGLLFVDLNSTFAASSYIGAIGSKPGGRLTLESGVPISTSDQTSKTTIYYTPYLSNVITLWDGNVWQSVEFAETSVALGTITDARPYDVFGYLSSGALALEILAWTSDSARATAVTLQDGRYCKSGDKTRLLLGTFRTTSTTTTEDSVTKRFLSNVYNQMPTRLYKDDTTNGHVYGTASWRKFNNTSSNMVEFVSWNAQQITMTMEGSGNSGASNQTWREGAALDSTTPAICIAGNNVTTTFAVGAASVEAAAAGYHYVAAVEYGGSSNWHGNIYICVRIMA